MENNVERKHYKLIILIIASHNEIYDKFASCWKAYMNEFAEVKSYFLYMEPNLEREMVVTEDSIIFKGMETAVPGILYKTYSAMKYCTEQYSYDYLLRTNLSSFFHIPRLLDFLSLQHKENYIGARLECDPVGRIILSDSSRLTSFKGLHVGTGFAFLHGSGIILSYDVVYKLVCFMMSNDIINTNIPDDVALSFFLYELYEPNYYIETVDEKNNNLNDIYCPSEFINLYKYRYVCTDRENSTYHLNNDIFHIRNKVSLELPTDECRNIDIANYVNQIQFYYNKPDFYV
jgi:hypothetical protein